MNCVVPTVFLFGILFNIGNVVVGISYVTDNDLDNRMKSRTGIAVLNAYSKELDVTFEEVITALEGASETLEKFDIKVYVIKCDESKADLCQNENQQSNINLFKKEKFITALPIDMITSQHTAEAYILDLLSPPTFLHVSDAYSWSKLKTKCVNKKNILMVYTPSLETALFRSLVKAALEYKEKIQIAYTKGNDLASTLQQNNVVNPKGTVWAFMCAEEYMGESCLTINHEDRLTQSDLDGILKAMVSLPVVEISSSASADALQNFIDGALEDNKDVIMMIAGHGKHTKAMQLAREACVLTIGKAHCVVIKGDVEITGVSDYIGNDRIFLSVLAKEGQRDDIEVGYLLSETSKEVYHHWRRLSVQRRVRKHLVQEQDNNEYLIDEDVNDIASPYDVQDDPVAYSVHSNKQLRDLYLHDYQTIPRLTDVTYDQLVSSDQYAVILFTLEFNAKTLAVLSTFVRIHKRFLADSGHSPLHRVECFDWPDVCQKAGYVTFPRMVIYRSDELRTSMEYDHIWSEDEMKKSIWLSSLDWPVVANSEQDLTRVPATAIHGVVSTESGEIILRKAARLHGSRYPFVMVRGKEAKSITSSQDISVDDGDFLLVYTSRGVVTRPFSSIGHVTAFIQLVFHSEPLRELTVSNFDEMLSDPLPMFIFYRNTSGGSPSSDDEIAGFLINIGAELKGRAIFVWMNASPGSPGEYALYMHSKGEVNNSALAFFDKKGSVSLKSLQGITNHDDIKHWVESSLSGNSPVTFKLLDVAWKPRLPGHDYLQYMRDEGAVPPEFTNLKNADEDQLRAPHFTTLTHTQSQKKLAPDHVERKSTEQVTHTEL